MEPLSHQDPLREQVAAAILTTQRDTQGHPDDPVTPQEALTQQISAAVLSEALGMKPDMDNVLDLLHATSEAIRRLQENQAALISFARQCMAAPPSIADLVAATDLSRSSIYRLTTAPRVARGMAALAQSDTLLAEYVYPPEVITDLRRSLNLPTPDAATHETEDHA